MTQKSYVEFIVDIDRTNRLGQRQTCTLVSCYRYTDTAKHKSLAFFSSLNYKAIGKLG